MHPRQFNGIDQETTDYICGQLAGDGHVGIYKNSVEIGLPKSIKAIETVKRFHNLLGGSITFRLGKGEAEAQCYWRVRGKDAISLISKLSSSMHVKKDQFILAAKYIAGHSYVEIIVKDDVLPKKFYTVADAARFLHLSADALQLRFARNGLNLDINGMKVSRYSGDQLSQNRAGIEDRLKDLKLIEEPLIVRPTDPFLAGFADAEMSLQIKSSKSANVSIPQITRGILEVFRDRFGGSIVVEAQVFRWQLRVFNDVKIFLENIRPWLFEKLDQADLILNMTESTWKADKVRLDLQKGVCLTKDRRKTIKSQADLNAFISKHTTSNGNVQNGDVSSNHPSKPMRDLPMYIYYSLNRKQEKVGYYVQYKKCKKYYFVDSSEKMEEKFRKAKDYLSSLQV